MSESLAQGYADAFRPGSQCTDSHDWRARHRVIDLLILVEFCRHPADPAQVDRVEEYVGLLGRENLAVVARDVQAGHRERVMADWIRFGEGSTGLPGVDDDNLSSFVHGLAGSAPGTLGRGLHDFYAGQNLPFPGDPGGGVRMVGMALMKSQPY